VADRWVINASPVICLGRLGYAGWFAELAERAVIPQAVVDEVLAGPDDEARHFVAEGGIDVVETPPPSPDLVAWDLGAGEQAVLAWAISEPDWIAILDDGQARRCARTFGVSVKGTLGLVLLAKRRWLIPSAAEVIRQLQRIDFRLDEELIRQVLAEHTGEAWP